MDVGLDSRVAVITGSTQGLGEAIARRCAEAHAAGVVITGRNGDRGERLAAELSALGSRTIFIAADLADIAAPAVIVTTAIETFGRVDCLVNAAGLTDRASLENGTLDDWERLFNVNARAPFFLMQAAVADMTKRNEGGSIVNIQSINALCGAPDLAIYSASKGALSVLTKNTANAYLAERIRANGINMGWTLTPGEEVMQGQTLGKGSDWAGGAGAGMPLKRLLSADEIARYALYLLSDVSAPMTGTVVEIEQTVIGAPGRWIPR